MKHSKKTSAFMALTFGAAAVVAPVGGSAYAETWKEGKTAGYQVDEAKKLISGIIEAPLHDRYKIALNHSVKRQAHKPGTLHKRPAINPGKGNKGTHPGKEDKDGGPGKGNGDANPGKGPKPGKGQEKAVDVSFLHLNDTHANLDQVAKRVSVVKEKRAENPETIVVDAGDVFSGTLYFNEFKGQADLAFMNLMQVDVMTFGNHEFDLGASQEGHRALVDFIKAAQFPFVSSNVDFSKDPIFKGLFNTKIKKNAQDGQIYTGIVKEVDGQKIGFFGLTTEETAAISNPGSITFKNYIEQAQKMVDEFEKMGINKVVAVTHIGFDDNAAIDNDQQLAKYVDGIDVIIGGHSHTKMEEPVVVNEGQEPTVIVQAYQYGDYVGALDVSFDKKGVITEYDGELIATADYEDDPEAVALLKPYKQKIEELQQTEIGVTLEQPLENPRTGGDATKPSVRKNETVLGNLITDGMLTKARQYDAEVVMALQNGGGIRNGIDAGPVTVGEVISVLPFGNTLATMRLTGAEIKAAFERSVSAYPNESGGFLHVAGARVSFDSTKPSGERVVSVQVEQGGSFADIVDEKTYSVATNAFTAKGGDGYEVFAKAYGEGRVTDLGLSDWENFRDHLVGLSVIPAITEGRIRDVLDIPEGSGDILISEYVEGSSNNKAIELYNGTGKAIDLSDYRLELYTNGKETVQNTQIFEGLTLAAGETLVLVHSMANEALQAKGDMTSSAVNFNGDDVLLLKRGDEIIDSFGQLGHDPGDAWVEGEVSSQNKTLVRLSATGDTNPMDEFAIADQWKAYPIDTFDDLGRHGQVEEEPEDPSQELISILQARNAGIGETVSVKGTVTAKLNNTFTVEDETAAITVYEGLDVAVGDVVTLAGTIGEYRNLLQLQDVSLKGKEVGTPLAPTVITGNQMDETNESRLVKLEHVRVLSGGPNNFTIEVDGVQKILRDEDGSLGIEVGASYESITGVIQQYNQDYQLLPRSVADLKLDSSVLRPVTASHAGGTIVGAVDVELTTTTADAGIYYTLDGSDPRENGRAYTAPITIDRDTVLKAVVQSADGAFSEVKTFEYKVTDRIRIHDIQGEGHQTSFGNQTVQDVEGIVTYMFEVKGAQYFTIQTPDEEADDNPLTSEGIFVYAGSNGYDVELGDKVAVTGTVSEYVYDGYDGDLKTTQINARNDRGGQVSIVSRGNELPEAFIIDESSFNPSVIDKDGFALFDPQEDAIDFWESIEGMRVSVTNVKAVAPQEYGDIATVLQTAETDTKNGGVVLTEQDANPERIQFRLEPNAAARTFNVNTGDAFNGTITGVVGNSYTNYKIHADLASAQSIHEPGAGRPERTTIGFAEDELTVASYNLENFSNNSSETSDEKAERLAEAIGNGMNTPDIVGLTEVQDNNGSVNDGTVSAAESYQRLIDLIEVKTGITYAYANIDPENNQDGGAPGANIRVGFLYNPERVSLEGTPGQANEATVYENGSLTLNPGRIDPTNGAFDNSRKPLAAQFTFNGESVVVIANHWNSKSGDTGLFGDTQPVVLGSEVQRKEIARVVADFITDIKTENEDANIIALGDFNDYEFSAALTILEEAGMHNKIKDLPIGDRYTYIYQGNSQVLDHVLVSSNLAQQTEIDVLHVNADFTEAAGRASDHDPVMIQIDFSNGIPAASTVDITENKE